MDEMGQVETSTNDAAPICAGRSRAFTLNVRVLAVSALLVVLGAGSAQAAPQQYMGVRSVDVWNAEDACVAKSIKLFPDHDLASQQNRDRAVDACLAAADLPPRAHLAPDP